jgi:tetratricopeptide (TPR) repeat protein
MIDDRRGLGETEFECCLIDFEEAWRNGSAPDLGAYLVPSSESTDDESSDRRVRQLLEMVPLDLEYRWRGPARGCRGPIPPRPRLEHYLERFPELGSRSGAAVELVGVEYYVRSIWGDRPEPSEYLGRFPGIETSLREELRRVADEIAREGPRDESDLPSCEQAVLKHAPNAPHDKSWPVIEGLECLGEIGRGGMGVVYKARDLSLGRIVAIKTIAHDQRAAPEQRTRFQAEARAVAKLRHPNIVAIHQIGEHERQPYLSLEFADGGDLDRHLAEKPMVPREAAALVETLARAMHVVHEAGIVHRDLKPRNVLMTSDGVPKITDFGLAKLLDANSERTKSGQVMGTPSYMSPEQADGRSSQVGPPADIYALGAILYKALTSRPPFVGGSELEIMRQVASIEPDPPRESRPDVPKDLETICLKCLQKETPKRYKSALDLADELRRFLDGRPIIARPVGPAGRLGRWAKRNPWVAGLAAAVFVSLILGTGVSTVLTIRAIRAEAATRQQRDRAEAEAATAKAFNEFLNKDLLATASPLNQTGLGSRPDPDIKLRTVLDRASATVGTRFAGQPLVEALNRQTLGRTYQQLGLYAAARPHLERSLELHRQELDPLHPDVLIAMNRLGSLNLADDKLAEAESLLIPALEGLRRILGPDHTESLTALSDVATLYVGRDKLDEAELLSRQVLAARRRLLGNEDRETLEAMISLANVYFTQGGLAQNTAKTDRARERFTQAGELLRQVLKVYERRKEPEHPTALLAKGLLAAVCGVLGQQSDGFRLLEETLKAQRRALGDKHPDTLATMVSVALARRGQGRLKDAEQLAMEALEGCRKTLDRNHETTDTALAVLALVYVLQGDRKKLGPVLIESRDITIKRFGRDHFLTFMANRAAAKFYLAEGEHAKGERIFRDALAWLVKNKPEDWDRFATEGDLGRCLLGQRKHEEAKRFLLSAYASMKAREKDMPLDGKTSIEQTAQAAARLYHESGPSRDEQDFALIRSDPAFIVERLDLEFPADPFAR